MKETLVGFKPFTILAVIVSCILLAAGHLISSILLVEAVHQPEAEQ